MTELLAAFLAAWLAVQPVASAEAGAATVDEALIERFISVLPGADRFDRVDRIPDPDELARLTGLNPGRDAEIRAMLEDHAGCVGAARNAQTKAMLGGVARHLGEEKVGRMIRFYERDEWRVLERLSNIGEANLTAAERAELARLRADYPLDDFRRAMNPFTTIDRPDELFAAERGCGESLMAAMQRLELRIGPDPIPVAAE